MQVDIKPLTDKKNKMEIGQNSPFGLYSQANRHAAGNAQTKTTSGSGTARLTPTLANAKDEYIPSSQAASASLTENIGTSASSVEDAIGDILKSHGVKDADQFALLLVIDKNGKFQSGGGSVNYKAYNWDDQDKGELDVIINELNNTKVKGVPLAEVMLEQFAKDSGMDLSAERRKDSFYYTCQIVNPKVLDPEAGSFVEVAIPVVSAGDTFYSREVDEPNVGLNYHYDDNGELIKKMVCAATRAAGVNDMDAPWNQNNSSVESGYLEPEEEKKDSSDTPFAFDTSILQKAITDILKEFGHEYKSGDSFVFDVSQSGAFIVDRNSSHIDGFDKDMFNQVASKLETLINAPDFWKNSSTNK